MHFKLFQSAEPLKAEALLLRGEDVSAANPRERFSLFAVARGLSISLLASDAHFYGWFMNVNILRF